MTQTTAPHSRSVLIVDDLEESRQVLRTVLMSRGMQVYEASGADQGLQMAQKLHPGLIVLDLDSPEVQEPSIREGYGTQVRNHNTQIVLLGTARRMKANLPTGQFISKPYHYGPLVRKIEQLLEFTQSTDRSRA